jgi:hypothetical protein
VRLAGIRTSELIYTHQLQYVNEVTLSYIFIKRVESGEKNP